MATYIIVPAGERIGKSPGLPHQHRRTRQFSTCVCTCDAKLHFAAKLPGWKHDERWSRTRALQLQVDITMCVASLCSKPAKNPTSMGSLSAGIRESHALKSPRSQNRKDIFIYEPMISARKKQATANFIIH